VAISGVGVALVLFLARRMSREANAPRLAVFLAAAFYALLVIGFSPTLKKQTFLPVYPLLALAAVGGVQVLGPRRAPWLESAVCVAFLTHQILECAPWRDGLAEQWTLLKDTLALTRPGDMLLDLKGETIFRRRPIYLVYVLATTRGMEIGRLPKEDPVQLSASDTAVVIGTGAGFPKDMRKYIKDHYLPASASRLWVAGSDVDRVQENGHRVMRADPPVAGVYVILANGSAPIGSLWVKKPGPQALDLPDRDDLLLYWKAAWDAGYRPR
jgi:hypothetical protein